MTMKNTAVMEKESAMSGGKDLKTQRVLVVDDEKSISELITTSLRFVGFDVRTAGTGTEAIQVAKDRKSTRLNSSHQIISYAVFCLKKKN